MIDTVPDIDVTPAQWAIIEDILVRHVPQHAVWVFGSRARRTAKPYSDLDLAVMTSHPMPLDVRAAIMDSFSESALPWKVDVVDWATTSESFRKVIEQHKVVARRPA